MFRRLAATVREDTESYLDGNKEAREYTGRLSYYGGMLVNYLHGHHGWEDHSYFPELSAADSRFDAGLAILEKDHVVLNQVLDDFTRTANGFIQLEQLDNTQARDEAGKLHTVSLAIETLLTPQLRKHRYTVRLGVCKVSLCVESVVFGVAWEMKILHRSPIGIICL